MEDGAVAGTCTVPYVGVEKKVRTGGRQTDEKFCRTKNCPRFVLTVPLLVGAFHEKSLFVNVFYPFSDFCRGLDHHIGL